MIKHYFLLPLVFVIFCVIDVLAQEVRKDKLYTVSGIGTSIPLAETSDYFGPKISTTLGVNLGLGKAGLFLFPKFSLHAFSYSGISADNTNSYIVQNGRASTYLLNVALGYRKMIGNFAYYGYAGGGGGFVLTPTAYAANKANAISMKNTAHTMPMLEAGAGVELSLGGLAIFTELSVMNGFNKIQDRKFTTMPITVGIKPNLSKVFK